MSMLLRAGRDVFVCVLASGAKMNRWLLSSPPLKVLAVCVPLGIVASNVQHSAVKYFLGVVAVGVLYVIAAQNVMHRFEKPEEEDTEEVERQERMKQRREQWQRQHEEFERRLALPLVDRIRVIIQQPVAKLPVSIDLPRLINKIVVRDHVSEASVVEVGGTSPQSDCVTASITRMRLVLGSIAYLTTPVSTERADEGKRIEREFSHIFSERLEDASSQIMDKQLAQFLALAVDDASGLALVLKACNQAVIAPAVMELKMGVGQNVPYKDVRGAWHIAINVMEDRITVTHQRQEQSIPWRQNLGGKSSGGDNDDEPGVSFVFLWEVEMTFDRWANSLISSSVKVVDVNFEEGTAEHRQQQVLDVFEEYR
eukprot:TRINITY_DN14630_c0_g1_i1.p1 TRINITY_DN14630_c0_g1~~TRINITY_DN14630_c0_g1_i1.p1  ORF type:complete len:369 (-),score=91.77 TRINITY_DN14630_c0_g1_i1:29-1135(-)